MPTATQTATVFEDLPPGERGSNVAGVAVGLRLLMGWLFLMAGLGKLLGEFSAAGYLANVDPTSPELIALIDVAVP